MPPNMLQQTKTGNGPKVATQEQLDEIRGKVCAVEFGSRELLGFGATWPECLEDVARNENADRSFYRFNMPDRAFKLNDGGTDQ